MAPWDLPLDPPKCPCMTPHKCHTLFCHVHSKYCITVLQKEPPTKICIKPIVAVVTDGTTYTRAYDLAGMDKDPLNVSTI